MLLSSELVIVEALRFVFNDAATTEIYTLSLHDALPICSGTGPDSPPSTPAAARWRQGSIRAAPRATRRRLHWFALAPALPLSRTPRSATPARRCSRRQTAAPPAHESARPMLAGRSRFRAKEGRIRTPPSSRFRAKEGRIRTPPS